MTTFIERYIISHEINTAANEVDIQRLVLQVNLLTESVEQLALCLLRGPCWGARGETEWRLSKAMEFVAEAKQNSQQNVQSDN